VAWARSTGCVLGVAMLLVAFTSAAAWGASSFTGSFKSELAVALPTDSYTIDEALCLSYGVSDWSCSSFSLFGTSGWTSQGFEARGLLGNLKLTSYLAFTPQSASFTSWKSTMAWTHADTSFGTTLELTPTGISLLVSLSEKGGDLPLDASVQFRSTGADCDFAFYRADIAATLPRCLDVSADCGFTASGLERATFSVSGIDIDRLPWLSLDASLSYTLNKKKLTLTPVFDFGGTESCIVITLAGDSTGQLSIGGIRITGVHLTCRIGDATVEDEVHLDPAEYLLGKYWEALSLTYSEAAGVDECWDPIEFSISAYYANKGFPSYLVAEASGGISLGESRTIGLGFGFELDTDVGDIELLTFSFEYSW